MVRRAQSDAHRRSLRPRRAGQRRAQRTGPSAVAAAPAGSAGGHRGFIGSEPKGRTTTLGRGGSDYTAALLGEALGVGRVDIWTDVPGIYTTDPRVVPAAKRIDKIGFEEAAEMATFGAKVLHPATLLPAVRSDIPVFVGSSRIRRPAARWCATPPKIRRCSARWRCAASKRC